MAVNNNGNLLDTAGEVAIDFVWGNFPIQPNDARPNTATGRLDPALDNPLFFTHNGIALSRWRAFAGDCFLAHGRVMASELA